MNMAIIHDIVLMFFYGCLCLFFCYRYGYSFELGF